jgi:2-polyprenyl-3-methyl-5-hydroxy-6-metoxy-1,4-benzoquinol methylase
MIKTILRRAPVEIRHRTKKLWSLITPYETMERGQHVLDAQYAGAEWDYLRSFGELPRFGVVSIYCGLLATGGSLLEIGCGDGLFLEQLDRSRFTRYRGVDISSVAIDRAQRLADERTIFTCADAEAFVPDGTFDLIIFNEVLEYFLDPLALVSRYEPYVSPGGHIVVSMYAAPYNARTQRIWRRLQGRYEVLAHTKVSTGRDFTWNVKVLRAPSAT